MAQRIATVSGTALVPGVSRNGRLYTRETIAKAVARAQDRIASGAQPLTMLTHHAAGDDSTRIVGTVRSLSLAEDGSARFTADLADTPHARTITQLVTGDTPYLRGVSIRGAWVGDVRREKGQDGRTVETADDLELDGLDFTRTPGVPGAAVDDIRTTSSSGAESTDGRNMIYESAEAQVTITEEAATEAADFKANTKPPGAKASDYADPGYQTDGKKRYLIDTKDRAKAAWSYINQADNAKAYTGAQLKRIKARIVKALKRFGVEVNTAEGYIIDPIGYVAESAELAEYYGDSSTAGSFRIELCNGPLVVTICSYCIDPADLDLIGKAAMTGAVQALKALDPDLDADIDVDGADSENTDDDMETGPADSLAETDTTPGGEPAPQTPAAEPAGDPETTAPDPAADQPEQEEPAMAEPTQAVEPTAPTPTITLTQDQFTQLLAATRPQAPAMAGAETAPAPAQAATETAAPAAPPVTETEDQRIARLVREGIAAERTRIVQEMVEAGGVPARKGVVDPVGETQGQEGVAEGLNEYGVPNSWPNKPLHEYTDVERMRYFGPAVREHVLQDRFKG